MKIAFFDVRRYDRNAFEEANQKHHHEIHFIEPRLTELTAPLAEGCDVVCAFVNDRLNAEVLQILKSHNVKLIALRSAGYNHVNLERAKKLSIPVTRVPEYSPHAVAEHAIALLLTLNRKIHRATARVKELNFSLDGLVGFDLYRKTTGVIGTGRIGKAFAQIARGFGCRVLATDPKPDLDFASRFDVEYVDFDRLLEESDVISLHAPLLPATRHLIDSRAISMMKNGVHIINTSRGGLIDTRSLIEGLKTGHIGGAGLDVYEEEENIFFRDLSNEILQDDTLARLLTFPNVVITSHQGFLTREALQKIAETTLESVTAFEKGLPLQNQVTLD